MKKTATVLLAAVWALQAFGNPIAVIERDGKLFTYYDARKQSENCVVLVGSERSVVSCEITYRLQKAKKKNIPSNYLGIVLPAFVAARDESSDADLMLRYKPTIEMGGKIYQPRLTTARLKSPDEFRDLPVPVDTNIVLFKFDLHIGDGQRQATVLVTYVQPSIGNRFVYLPFFEDHSTNSGFVMDLVAQLPTTRIRCTMAPPGVVAYAARLRVPLRDKELIEVAVDDANQLPDPTPPSVTPPAGAGGPPSVAADH